MRMGQVVRTGLGHGSITCVIQTQFFSYGLKWYATIVLSDHFLKNCRLVTSLISITENLLCQEMVYTIETNFTRLTKLT